MMLKLDVYYCEVKSCVFEDEASIAHVDGIVDYQRAVTYLWCVGNIVEESNVICNFLGEVQRGYQADNRGGIVN